MTAAKLALLAIAGGTLSFLSLGILWIGVNPLVQAVATFGFFGLSFAGAKFAPGRSETMGAILLGASPLGAMITMFRDAHDSHALPLFIVSSWFVAVFFGYKIGRREV